MKTQTSQSIHSDTSEYSQQMQLDKSEKLGIRMFLFRELFNVFEITSVLSAKNNSDVMFCLQL